VAAKKYNWPKLIRDWILFVTGLAGIIHETILTNLDRPTLLFAFMAMVGLPAFLRADEKKKPSGSKVASESPSKLELSLDFLQSINPFGHMTPGFKSNSFDHEQQEEITQQIQLPKPEMAKDQDQEDGKDSFVDVNIDDDDLNSSQFDE
jgi:hypothetical protein